MKKHLRVGVLTFHDYDNYGALLQSYALQRVLGEMGADPCLIDYSCPYIRHPFALDHLKKKGLFNYLYGVIGYLCYRPRHPFFQRFRKRLTFTPRVTRESFGEVASSLDVVVTGSDQLWNVKLTDLDTTYFLDLVPEGTGRVAYAVSTGEALPKEESREQLAGYLKRFDRILVREDYGADYVESLTGSRPDLALDPTLLLTGEEWEKLLPPAKKARKRKPYLLLYQLGIDPSLVSLARQIAKREGLAIHVIPFPLVE